MNWYEKIIRKGEMAADDYRKKKKESPVEDLNITEEELQSLEHDAVTILEDVGNPFDPIIK